MIHHISIPARDPRHVAEVLAELLRGRAYPFSGALPGAYMAVSGDAHGTMIEVYPETVVLTPGRGEDQSIFLDTAKFGAGMSPTSVGFHALVSLPLDREEIERIGAREG